MKAEIVRRLCLPAVLLIWGGFLPAQALSVSFTRTNASGPAAGSPSAAISLPSRVVRALTSYLGVPYVHAGDTRQGMDCSGLVARVFFDTMGASLPRGVEALYHATAAVQIPLHIGDLLFFDTSEQLPAKLPTHVGVYIGAGKLIHAASEGPRTGVIVSRIGDPYYRDRYIGARRVLPWRDPVLDVSLTDEKSIVSEIEPFASREDLVIRVFNGMTGGGPVSFTLLKDGREVLSRWISPSALKPAEVPVRTGIGAWSIRITRIFRGRTLSDVAFSVME
jgi:hypothetical protein